MRGASRLHDLGRVATTEPQLLRRALAHLDNVQVASQLDTLPAAAQDLVLHTLGSERRPSVLEHMRLEAAASLVSRIAAEDAAKILEELDLDDVTDILQQLPPERLRDLLSRFDPEDIEEVEELLTYDPSTAGGLMTPEIVSVGDEVTVAEALRIVQETQDLPDQAFYVYVVDDEERLVGVTSLRVLVTRSPDLPIRDVMRTSLVSVSVSADQEDVAHIVSRYDVVSVPVVDAQGCLLGVVTVDDVVDVLREEATEDILKMAGAGEAMIDTQSFWASFRARLPWLMGAALGGLVVALSLTGFEDALRAVPVLALFMPVVAGMGGNVGTQSSTIVVRGLAVGYIDRRRLKTLVLREVALGALLGVVTGLTVSAVASGLGFEGIATLPLVGVLTGGLVGSMTIAAAVGSGIPLVLERLQIDPAVATGPFVTTAVDVLGLLFYFGLASVLLETPV